MYTMYLYGTRKSPKETIMGVWKVQIIESERGWGQKVDETKEFKTFEEARKFQKDFNKPNEEDYAKTKFVPDWYMYATEPYLL